MSLPLTNQTVAGERNIFTGTGDIKIIYNLPPPEAEEHRNLLILLKRVEQFWVEGVLEKSVHNEALLDIDKEIETGAVDHPWESVLELPNKIAATLPAGKKNSEIFDEVARSLLLLGEPGSGKTISLLELTRDLINKVKDDPSQPVPVVFNLSTWATKHRTFSDWLIDELKTKYFIPHRMGKSWLEKNRLLLFLDGLDEVKQGHRANCVDAINEFTQEFGVPGIVVCSRITEYLALPLRLKFNGAIRLKPLSLDQVDSYLARAGAGLAALRATLQQDSQLQVLAQSPLMLSIMSVAYQDQRVAVPVTKKDTAEAGYEHVFDTYIQRMFERRGKGNQQFSQAQTKRWLAWLAQRMRENSQTIFLIEQLQPSWLSTRLLRSSYVLSSRVFAGIIWGTSLGLALGIFTLVGDFTRHESMIAMLGSLIFGLTAGLTSGIRDLVVIERNGRKDKMRDKTSIRHLLIAIGFYSLIWSLLLLTLVSLSERGFSSFNETAILGLFAYVLLFGILQLLVFGPRYKEQTLRSDISTYETLSWSWSSALKSSWWGGALILAVAIALLVSVSLQRFEFERMVLKDDLERTERRLERLPLEIEVVLDQEERDKLESEKKALIRAAQQYRTRIENESMDNSKSLFLSWIRSLNRSDLLSSLLILLIIALVGGFIGALFGGLTTKVIEMKSSPNQGIKLTIKNTVLAGGIIGSIIGLVTGSFVVYINGFFSKTSYVYGMEGVLIAGIITGTIISLRCGGLDTIKHFLLRALIVLKGNAPKGYPKFLDYASNLILLQKVGGGYIFIHRLLLEYFADLPVSNADTSDRKTL